MTLRCGPPHDSEAGRGSRHDAAQPWGDRAMTPRSRVVISLSLLLTALLAVRLYSHGEAVPLRQNLDRFPADLGAWQGREANLLEDEVVNILKVKDYLIRRYVDAAGQSTWLYIGYHDTQRRGAQFHSPKNCLPGGGWEPVRVDRVPIDVAASARAIVVNRYLIQKDDQRQLVVYWYQLQGRAIAGELGAKIQMVRGAMTRNRTDGALIRISSPIYGSPEQTFAVQAGFVQALYPVLGQFLPD
jgi:EpsI family protein